MRARTVALVGLIVLAALARLVPHPPNFTPVGALALFAGAHFPSRRGAFLVPLAAMLLSDVGLELAGATGFYPGMGVVYGTLGLITAVGLLLRRKKTLVSVAGGVLACSVLFFLVTNFAWWAGYDLYPHTVEGLLLSYTAALPFFPWTLLGDCCYGLVLFGGFALLEKRFSVLRPAQPAARAFNPC